MWSIAYISHCYWRSACVLGFFNELLQQVLPGSISEMETYREKSAWLVSPSLCKNHENLIIRGFLWRSQPLVPYFILKHEKAVCWCTKTNSSILWNNRLILLGIRQNSKWCLMSVDHAVIIIFRQPNQMPTPPWFALRLYQEPLPDQQAFHPLLEGARQSVHHRWG